MGISTFWRLLCICVNYAVGHGLRYNANKSELVVFRVGNKSYDEVPSIILDGVAIQKVTKFKYLGHRVTEKMTDNVDIENHIH